MESGDFLAVSISLCLSHFSSPPGCHLKMPALTLFHNSKEPGSYETGLRFQ